MEEFRENINSLSNTGTLENILIGLAYWLAVVVILLFVFYVAVKIHNYRLYKRHGKIEKDDIVL